MKRILYGVLALLAGCSGNEGNYDASGTFEATEVIVSSEASGRLMRFDVEEGQTLRAGETVGIVDTVQLYLKRLQLLTNRRAVDTRRQDIAKQIAATEEEIAKQRREKARTEGLLERQAANRKQLDDIESAIAVLEKQLAAQRSTLERGNRGVDEESSALDVQVAQIDDQLAKCRIASPIDGTVLVKYAEPGEVTAAGKPLFKAADVRHMRLRAYVTSGQLTGLKLGQRVTVYADEGEERSRPYEGTVSWIADQAEFTPKTIQTRDERANLVYAVKIDVPNDGLLKIGMYGDVKF